MSHGGGDFVGMWRLAPSQLCVRDWPAIMRLSGISVVARGDQAGVALEGGSLEHIVNFFLGRFFGFELKKLTLPRGRGKRVIMITTLTPGMFIQMKRLRVFWYELTHVNVMSRIKDIISNESRVHPNPFFGSPRTRLPLPNRTQSHRTQRKQPHRISSTDTMQCNVCECTTQQPNHSFTYKSWFTSNAKKKKK